MAVPKRRTSKSKKRMRRTHKKITPVGMSLCMMCGEMKRNHHVCKSCGNYDGEQVLNAQ